MLNNKANPRWMLLAGFTALGLLATGCGDSDDNSADDIDTTATTVVDGAGTDDAVTSVPCAEDDPDCEDTDVAGDSQGDQPDTTEGGGEVDSSSETTVNGGLTVSEVLATEATGVLAVKGHLYDEGAGPALCETLVGRGERYGCEGPLLPVEGLDLDSIGDDVIIHDGLTYTETEITVLGELVDGTLVIDALSS